MHGAYTPEELEDIKKEKHRKVVQAEIEENTTVMVKIEKIRNGLCDVYALHLSDGTNYLIDEFTAVGMEDQVRAYLKTRL